jgi:hypothetical protein
MPYEPYRARRQDLPGFRSHVRYSVFKDRAARRALRQRRNDRPSQCEKRTGNLAATVDGVNRDESEVGCVPTAAGAI